jgi:hypothetical protein
MVEPEALTRASFVKLVHVLSPEPVPPPDRIWSADEWAMIRRGHRSRDMDDKWHAFVEANRLFLHRSWTGLGVYEAEFVHVDGGWRIRDAIVCGDRSRYRRGSDEYESLLLEWLISRVLLGNRDDQLWQRIKKHGPT